MRMFISCTVRQQTRLKARVKGEVNFLGNRNHKATYVSSLQQNEGHFRILKWTTKRDTNLNFMYRLYITWHFLEIIIQLIRSQIFHFTEYTTYPNKNYLLYNHVKHTNYSLDYVKKNRTLKYSYVFYIKFCQIIKGFVNEQHQTLLLPNYLHIISFVVFYTVSMSRCIYRVIQEEKSILREVISIGHCERKCSYEYVPNSDWFPRYSCLNLRIQKYCDWQ
jgi:hypothetical protein